MCMHTHTLLFTSAQIIDPLKPRLTAYHTINSLRLELIKCLMISLLYMTINPHVLKGFVLI